MPLFDYKCPECGCEREELVKRSDDTVECQKCKVVMEKQVGLSSFQLKGEGWYRDGYSSKKEKQ